MFIGILTLCINMECVALESKFESERECELAGQTLIMSTHPAILSVVNMSVDCRPDDQPA